MASFPPARWECLPLEDLDRLLDELDSATPIAKLRAAAFMAVRYKKLTFISYHFVNIEILTLNIKTKCREIYEPYISGLLRVKKASFGLC
jgi:hypothetical protein